ncbi:P-loop NTPase fold protein [Citrobacter sp. U14242]|uniref:P-loop NTPase fold protein n=1 Tax=Citrobacter sp. U14242 TaxID=3390192 RepID=UPI00397A4339
MQLLGEGDNKVIALSGKWGTGKSFMWEQVKKTSSDEVVKAALYVSLFGLSNLEQVKMKLIQSAVPSIETYPGIWDGTKKALASGIKVLEGFHKGFSALNDIGIVFSPTILRNKLIVLDDIERKHEKLNIDEVLGFIDEFTQQHGCRFILILNSDQLAKRDIWDLFREKVIDQEIKLITSPSEAFDIAVNLTASRFEEQIRKAIVVCGLTNIRIIRKVIKVVNSILEGKNDMTEAVLWRVIPSTVLLASIHYKGIDDGPDFDFVLNRDVGYISSLIDSGNTPSKEENKHASKWRQLIKDLSIPQCDEFELLVVEYLGSGLFESSKVSSIIDRYINEDEATNSLQAVWIFFEKYTWDHNLTECFLLSEAAVISKKAEFLDAQTVSSLYEVVSSLSGGGQLADKLIDDWINTFKFKNHDDLNFFNLSYGNFHPKIKSEFDKIKATKQANLSFYDACRYVVENRAWGSRQIIALNSATVQDIELFIRNGDISSMRFFMTAMLDFWLHKENYESSFKAAMDNFVQACKIISSDKNKPRLSQLIRNLFLEAKLDSFL